MEFMPGNRTKHDTSQTVNLKSIIDLEKSLQTKNQNPLSRRLNRLFEVIKIDHKALKETLEITFWK